MKDNETVVGSWKPGKSGVNFQLSTNVASFLHTCGAEVAAKYDEADNHVQLLNLLEEAGWESAETNYGRTTYQNRFRTVRTSQTTELRFTVSVDDKGRCSTMLREWYR
jgi:hypothetical protein